VSLSNATANVNQLEDPTVKNVKTETKFFCKELTRFAC